MGVTDLQKVELAFGKHALSVFNRPHFSGWVLKTPPVERRTFWQVWHEGYAVVVKKQGELGKLVHLLRDPVKKGNLLALRCRNEPDGSLKFALSAVSPAGEEMRVGMAKVSSMRFKPSHASFDALMVISHTPRKPATRVEPRVRDFDSGPSADFSAEETAPQQTHDLLEELYELQGPFSEGKISLPPELRKKYAYQGKGFGRLLIELVEEVCRQAGFKAVEGDLSPYTTGRFLGKHGWKITESDEGLKGIKNLVSRR